MRIRHLFAGGVVLSLAVSLPPGAMARGGPGQARPQHDPGAGLPASLHETGLYAPGSNATIAPDVIAFSPQYPLWSDGADKRRWLWLPPGSRIDASRPDQWEFPPGTRLWKQFEYAGQPVETRFIERQADGSWRFATYVWDDAKRSAVLAPAEGVKAVAVQGAPQGRYALPSRMDCLACHGSAAVPVLGLSAVQLSGTRDPLAPGGKPRGTAEADLRALVARGVLVKLPEAMLTSPPAIAGSTPVERAALGYLHANCGHCHNSSPNRVSVRLTLAQRAGDPAASRLEVLRATVDANGRWRAQSDEEAPIVSPGKSAQSLLVQRMQSRDPLRQMPPLGTQVTDAQALALLSAWINDLSPRKEGHR
ncbi:c-type cytochrome domain-containing protein [Ramlibacter sp. AN1015]|uniref:c-type cytochrome domain-containing protein n=1 Tax=Ramlibacter sp. AN1015 TaxID=3133428 RepID=UPI0030BF1017